MKELQPCADVHHKRRNGGSAPKTLEPGNNHDAAQHNTTAAAPECRHRKHSESFDSRTAAASYFQTNVTLTLTTNQSTCQLDERLRDDLARPASQPASQRRGAGSAGGPLPDCCCCCLTVAAGAGRRRSCQRSRQTRAERGKRGPRGGARGTGRIMMQCRDQADGG